MESVVSAMHPQRGFLPQVDPCDRLPAAFDPWEELAAELPTLLAVCQARRRIERLPVIDARGVDAPGHLDRAMMLLSFFGHAAVWESGPKSPNTLIPRAVAVPWFQVAQRLGRPPVLSYASHGLNNWRRLDPAGPIVLENLAVQQAFLGGMDESWFILTHIEIEAKGAPIPAAAKAGQEAVVRDDGDALLEQLNVIARAQREMFGTLLRLQERCDPYIFFHRIQPFLHGFQQHPIVYEGVEELRGEPQAFIGASAAQSALLPLLDAALGIRHEQDWLSGYLLELRRYMPPAHARFLQEVERGPSIRDLVLRQPRGALAEAYNTCVEQLYEFRQKHLEVTAVYILQQAREQATERGEHGTGGTPFMRYLKKHRDETRQHLIA